MVYCTVYKHIALHRIVSIPAAMLTFNLCVTDTHRATGYRPQHSPPQWCCSNEAILVMPVSGYTACLSVSQFEDIRQVIIVLSSSIIMSYE